MLVGVLTGDDLRDTLSDVVSEIPMAITVWGLDVAGDDVVLLWMNKRAEENAGQSLEQWLGARASEIPAGLVPSAPALSAALTEAARGGNPDIDSVSLRGRVYRTYLKRVRAGIVAVMSEDCTEEYLAFTRLSKKAEDLKRSNQDLEQLAYVAGHDLAEPLRIIRNYIALLLEDHGHLFVGDAALYMRFIAEHAEKGQELINALLKYSRVGRAAQRVEVRSEDTVEWITKVYADVTKEHGVQLTTGILPDVYADPVLLRQGLQNLVGNAIKFRSDTKVPKVHLSCDQTTTHWVFCVEDNGIGFDPRQAADALLLFRRMHTLEKSGTGIGLAICERIAKLHGGACWLAPVPGVGTRAYLSIAKDAP